ncbi:LIM and senescent cell antigen-like-containing domain protein 2, partial [Quaeritorhiza haematococci]
KPQTFDPCTRCKRPIKDCLLIIKGQKFHAFHFNCTTCKQTLTSTAKEYEGKLYCKNDYERLIHSIPICFACRMPIYGRSVGAMGKQFHPEHFVCSKCEKPFTTSHFWEYQSKAYCEYHYNELVGGLCGFCYEPISGQPITLLNRRFCEAHFRCMGCHENLGTSSSSSSANNAGANANAGGGGNVKFGDWDRKLYCRRCWDSLPLDVRKQLGKYAEIEKKVLQEGVKAKKK